MCENMSQREIAQCRKRKKLLHTTSSALILLCALMYSTHHEIMRVVHDSSAKTNEKIIVNCHSAFTLYCCYIYKIYTERSLKVAFFPYLRNIHTQYFMTN